MRHNPMQLDRPLFVKVPFDGHSKSWKKGQHFPWQEMSMDVDVVHRLFLEGFIHHNAELEAGAKVGDGLEMLDIDSLHAIVKDINEAVKKHTRNKTEYEKKKCATSKIVDKQRGLIRRWRNLYGEMETA